MAKNRRKKSSKCPEPFNTLIDFAAAATLDYIAYKRRQKRGGKKRNKKDPYAAARNQKHKNKTLKETKSTKQNAKRNQKQKTKC